MAAKDDARLAKMRAEILDAAIENTAFDGFTPRAIDEAVRSLKLDPERAALAFPGGPKDLLRAWSESLDDAVRAELEAADLKDLKIRARVAKGVRLRIEKMASRKISARRAAAFLALPLHAPLAAELSFRTADAIWRGIGDTSADFNYYTKRLLLAGVVTSTMLYWFGDDSEDSQPTWDFIDRRIENVMSFEKAKAGVQNMVSKLPSPFALLGALRYPSRGG